MDISHYLSLHPFDDKCDFAVGLKIMHAIDDMASGILQFFCPLHIVLFIKPRLQLDKDCDLLVILGSTFQCLDDGRVAGDTVQRLLYSQYVRIFRRFLHEIHNRFKTLKRMMEEYILSQRLLIDIPRSEEFRLLGHEWLIYKMRQTFF